MTHRFGGQHLLVDGEYLAFDFYLDRCIASKEKIRRLFLDHQFEQRLGVHHLRWELKRRIHELKHLAFFFLDNLQCLAALFRSFHLAFAFQFDAQAQFILESAFRSASS